MSWSLFCYTTMVGPTSALEWNGELFLLFSLHFTSYFGPYLKIGLADNIRYHLLWCVTFILCRNHGNIQNTIYCIFLTHSELSSWSENLKKYILMLIADKCYFDERFQILTLLLGQIKQNKSAICLGLIMTERTHDLTHIITTHWDHFNIISEKIMILL